MIIIIDCRFLSTDNFRTNCFKSIRLRRERENCRLTHKRIASYRSFDFDRPRMNSTRTIIISSTTTTTSSSILLQHSRSFVFHLYHNHHHCYLHHHHHHRSFHRYRKRITFGRWSPANIELIKAIVKVFILVILKIIFKYYVRCWLQFYVQNSFVLQLFNLISKALTIATAKIAIKWALYPVLRTAMKTFLIASMKTLLKPYIKLKLKKKTSKKFHSDSEDIDHHHHHRLTTTLIQTMISIKIKTIIKIIALQLLWFMFENDNPSLTLSELISRITLIILVKKLAKKSCKQLARRERNFLIVLDSYKHSDEDIRFWGDDKKYPNLLESKSNESNSIRTNTKSSSSSSSSSSSYATKPIDEILLYALIKLVTKLIKIPMIKILFD